jgi:hypothetical protein
VALVVGEIQETRLFEEKSSGFFYTKKSLFPSKSIQNKIIFGFWICGPRLLDVATRGNSRGHFLKKNLQQDFFYTKKAFFLATKYKTGLYLDLLLENRA